MRNGNNINTILIIVIIAIFGYWQVSFLFYGLKWDLIDVVLPFRYYYSECLNSGYFPFWNPYQQTGTPFYLDLQAPTYYPELLIVSLMGRYGIYTMHVLFVAYLIIAAIGMYRLALYFNQSKNASMLASLGYIFCGYFIGHGQHFFLLVGAAWIPFVILSYIKMNQDFKLVRSIKAAVFVFLLITGAYQALSITMIYLLFLMFIYFIVKELISRSRDKVFGILKANSIFLLTTLILALPLIVSTLEVLNSVERLKDGINIKQTLALGQPFTAFLSFLVPFSTLKNTLFYGNINTAFINHYFGIIPLIFFLVALFKKHSVLEYILLGYGLVIFSMSFEFLPFRAFMYHHVPFMDLFYSAAYIRIYGFLSFILIFTKYFSVFEKNMFPERKKLMFTGTVFLVVFLGLIILSVQKVALSDFKVLFESDESLIDVLNKMSVYQYIVIQALFQIIIVCAFIGTLFFYRRLKYPIAVISILILSELLFAAQLNMHVTVIDVKQNPRDMNERLDLAPKGFPIPVNNKVILNDQLHAFYPPFWRNTYIFSKQVAFDAFSSFELDSYSKLDDTYPDLRTAVLNNHLFYFSDTILPTTRLHDEDLSLKSSKQLFLTPQDYSVLKEIKVKSDSTDLIKIKEFSLNKIVVETQTQNDQFLTVLQTNYKGWKAYIDDNETPIYTSNFNYRTILLSKGKHVVKYEYKNNKIILFYAVSNSLFFLCVLFLLGYWLFTKYKRGKNYLYIPLLIFLFILSLVILRFSKKHTNQDVYEYYNTIYPSEEAYIREIHDFALRNNVTDTITADSNLKQYVVDSTTKVLMITEIIQNKNKIKDGTLKVSFNLLPKNYNKILVVSVIEGKWHARRAEQQIEKLNQWNSIMYLRPVPKLDDGELITVYLWNIDKSRFMIDSVSVELFE